MFQEPYRFLFDIGVLTNTFSLDTGDDETFSSEQNWYNFKMGFSLNPLNGFEGQPQTTAEAIDAGWQQISNDCSEGAR